MTYHPEEVRDEKWAEDKPWKASAFHAADKTKSDKPLSWDGGPQARARTRTRSAVLLCGSEVRIRQI